MEPIDFLRGAWRRVARRSKDLKFTAEVEEHPSSDAGKLVIVSHDAHLDGAPLLILHVAQALCREFGVEVATVLMGDGPLREEFGKLGPLVDFTRPHWRVQPSAETLKARARELRRLRAAGFQHAICNTTVSGGLVPLLHQHGFRTIVLVHELPKLMEQLNLTKTAATIAQFADRVIFPATFVRDRFNEVAQIDDAKCLVRPQGLYRTNPFRGRRDFAKKQLAQALGLPDDRPVLIGGGPADRRKGIDIFCQVASLVLKQIPEATFVWLGDDEKDLARDCKDWLGVLGLSSQVRFTGLIREAEVYSSYIAAADVFMMTSREDPFPSVVLDAMTVGVPVVGFQDAGGFADLLIKGGGLLAPYEDRAAMANAAISLIQASGKAQAIGESGQQIIDEEFAFRDYVEDLLRLVGIRRAAVSAVIANSET